MKFLITGGAGFIGSAIRSSEFSTNVVRPENSRLDTCALESTFGTFASDWVNDLDSVLQSLKENHQ